MKSQNYKIAEIDGTFCMFEPNMRNVHYFNAKNDSIRLTFRCLSHRMKIGFYFKAGTGVSYGQILWD